VNRYLLFVLLLASACFAQTESYVAQCATHAQCTLASNVPWSQGNQVWIFATYQTSETIQIYIHNNNPTSAHTSQTVQAYFTDATNVGSLINNSDQWALANVQLPISNGTSSGNACNNVAANSTTNPTGLNGKATCYVTGTFASQVAIRMTGAAGAAGSPDTFDIGVVQQSGVVGGPNPGQDLGQVVGLDGLHPTMHQYGLMMQGNANPNAGGSNPIDVEVSSQGGIVIAGQTFPGVPQSVSSTNSAPFMTGQSANGKGASLGIVTEKGARNWISSSPAAGSQASAVQPADSQGVNILDCVSYSAASSGAVTAANVTLDILDGASVRHTLQVAIPAAAGAGVQLLGPILQCGMNISNSANNATMTCRFSAGVANVLESVNCSFWATTL
jgi:hypothetical protein